jgi:hypothetical protein
MGKAVRQVLEELANEQLGEQGEAFVQSLETHGSYVEELWG